MQIPRILTGGFSRGKLALLGVGSGLIAGITLVIVQMIMSVATGSPLFRPLRLTGSVLLGDQVLDSHYSLVQAGVTGLFLHTVLSIIYSLIFVYWLAANDKLDVSAIWFFIYGSCFGLLLWFFNFVIIAPLFFEQFTLIDPFWHGLLAYTFGYGAVLGGCLVTLRPKRSVFEAAIEEVLRV